MREIRERDMQSFPSLAAYENHLFALLEQSPKQGGAHLTVRTPGNHTLNAESAGMVDDFAQWLWEL